MATSKQSSAWQKRETWFWVAGFVFAFVILFQFGRIPKSRRQALVGKIAPDIEFSSSTGETKSLRDFKGKVLMINFWATWCQPCMEEMPALRQLEDKLADRGFELLAFNVAGEDPNLLSQVPKNMLPRQLIYSFVEEGLDPYGVEVIPLSVVINRDGEVSLLYLGPRDWAHPKVVGQIEKLL